MKSWPPRLAILLFVCITVALCLISVAQNGTPWMYIIDDVYIQMAIAKNLAAHGIWGVTPDGFTGASSSLLWPPLLAVSYAITGPNEIAPLLLNCVFVIGAIFIADVILRKGGLTPVQRMVTLVAIVLLAPIPAITFIGMEHTLQLLITLAFAWLAAQNICTDVEQRSVLPWLALLAIGTTMIRFEGAFVIGAVTLLLLLRRRWTTAMVVAIAGALPIIIYALVSMNNGWYPLPNSVLIKGNRPDFGSIVGVLNYLGYNMLLQMQAAPHLFVLILAALALLIMSARRYPLLSHFPSTFVLIAIISALVHLQIARTGWFYRYEAYLMAMLIAGVAILFVEERDRLRRFFWPLGSVRIVTVALVVLMLAPMVERGIAALWLIPQALRSTYEYHYQMGRFVARYYNGASITAHDIGAIDYFADIHLLDLAGLANLEVVNSKRAGTFNTAMMDTLVRRHNTRIIIAYEKVFLPKTHFPDSWIKVARWQMATPSPTYSADWVEFFALDSSEALLLRKNLQEFQSEMPDRVKVEYKF